MAPCRVAEWRKSKLELGEAEGAERPTAFVSVERGAEE
jgi:hypothetical protein